MAKPSAGASANRCARSAASHMAFFGTQPTLTQVPPSGPSPISATLAPWPAARNAAARPPEHAADDRQVVEGHRPPAEPLLAQGRTERLARVFARAAFQRAEAARVEAGVV